MGGALYLGGQKHDLIFMAFCADITLKNRISNAFVKFMDDSDKYFYALITFLNQIFFVFECALIFCGSVWGGGAFISGKLCLAGPGMRHRKAFGVRNVLLTPIL